MSSNRSDKAWYVNFGDGSTTGYYAVPVWTNHTAVAGEICRQATTPAVGSERCFICTTGGATGSTEPTWVITRGALTTDGSAVWQEISGNPAVNGDPANVPTWAQVKAASTNAVLGQVCKNTSTPDTYLICTAAGAMSETEPAWNKTAGQTTTDTSATWTSLGAMSGFTTLFAAPHARLGNAFTSTWGADGNTYYVASNHAETQNADLTINCTGSNNLPSKIYCVSSTSLTTLAETASITTTGASDLFINTSPFAFFHGITFNAGSGANGAILGLTDSDTTAHYVVCTKCGFNLKTTGSAGASNTISFKGYIPEATVLIDCTVSFGNALQRIGVRTAPVGFTMIGGSIGATGTAPTKILKSGSRPINAKFYNVDLSAVSTTLADAESFIDGTVLFANCKVAAGVAVVDNTEYINGKPEALFKLHNSDSSATNYRYYFVNGMGVAQSETTIVRTGGASDGVTPISWNITTTAYAQFYFPFVTEDIAVWNEATGSALTAEVYLTSDTVLTNADVWLEVAYPSSASNPLGATVTTRAADIFATPAALTADTVSTWGGAAKTYKYKITSPEFTPQMKGPVKVRVYVAKPSTTIYVDPAPVITGITNGNSYLIAGWGYLCQAAAAAAASGGAALSRIFTGM